MSHCLLSVSLIRTQMKDNYRTVKENEKRTDNELQDKKYVLHQQEKPKMPVKNGRGQQQANTRF